MFATKGRFRNFRDEVLIKELNLVDGPEPASVFWQKFGNPANKEKSSSNPLKDVIKSLYRYESIRQNSRRNQSPTYEVTNSNDSIERTSTSSPVVMGEIRSVAPPVLQDISEIVFHPPSQVEIDKSQRFTHSIRYGYGAPY